MLLVVATAMINTVSAQTGPQNSSANGAASTTGNEENVVQLSPFEVSAAREAGYQATETLAGTRIRTNLGDIGASISVLTQEFLRDIGATDSSTLLQYTTNAEVAGTRGTYAGLGNGTSVDESGNLRSPAGAQRVRGLAAADNARDYYITDIPWDSYNVDRIDILRGPNSILFGLGSPAGIVNASLRNAEFADRGEVTARVGSYGSYRGTIDVNREILSNTLAIRVDALLDNQKYQQKPAFQNDHRIYGALRWDPQIFKNRSFRTSIRVKIEGGDIKANRPRIVPPNDGISPWFRPVAVSAANPFGGMGRLLVNNAYDPFRTTSNATIVAGNGLGMGQSSTVNYQPWMSDVANQQQPVWLIDGATNQTYSVFGGYINNGGRNTTGGFTGISSGIPGKRQSGMLFMVNGGLSGVVNNYNNSTAYAGTFPNARYGQYRTMSLLDPTVFDFYGTLIDGPTKSEFQKWTAYNIDLSQTGWDDRVGLDVSYDRQKNKNGGQALLGGNPTLSMDITKNFVDYYINSGTGGVENANLGRPFVQMSTGNGSSYFSDREFKRASLFAELRVSDLTKNEFLIKLLGRHRFNGVVADERFYNEQRNWAMYANSQAWVGYWNNNAGNSTGLLERPPVGVIYLGSSIANRSGPNGANIPGIATNITLQDSGVYVMDSTWMAPSTVGFNDPWNVPANLYAVYAGLPNTDSGSTTPAQLTQASNPANYLGWNSNFQDNLLRYNNGADQSLVTTAQKSLRETTSYSGSYQGYLWNDALVLTLGWRFDTVKTKDVNAGNQPLNRSILNLQPDVYKLPDAFPTNQIVKGHSTSGGLVLHLNKILNHDPLPINVSVSYNESSNFQVTSIRRDLYGTPLGNPAGRTREYGIWLSTKDNRISFRAVRYTTRVTGASSGLSNQGGIGGTIQQGLKWRNVFLYQLNGYDYPSRNSPSYRNTWTNAYPLGAPNGLSATPYTQAQADADEDSAITTWNNIQTHLAALGFFQAWNFNPTGPASALVNRTTYLTNPTAYAPDPATVYIYTALPYGPQGFTVTADTESKGDEFELTANPLPNWRIAFNASRTSAVRTNVGGQTLTDFVTYMDSQLLDPTRPGGLSPAGGLPQFGGAGSSIGLSNWMPWKAAYTLMRLQEGSAAPEIRKWRYNVVMDYSFIRGMLKGFGVGGAYRWQDKVIIGYPVLASGVYDLTNPYSGPAEDGLDLWLSYGRKVGKNINWKIQFNVRNVLAKNGLIPISIEPDGHTWASVRVKPIQEWFVTNTFSF